MVSPPSIPQRPSQCCPQAGVSRFLSPSISLPPGLGLQLLPLNRGLSLLAPKAFRASESSGMSVLVTASHP